MVAVGAGDPAELTAACLRDAAAAFARAVPQDSALAARVPGTTQVPVDEAAAAIDAANAATESGSSPVILTALSGHGHVDMAAYDAYLSGSLVDHSWDDTELQESVARALTRLPKVPA